MFELILEQMREKVRALDYVMTTHAEEEMDNDQLSIFDVELILLSGQIVERQQDHQTDEWKYVIEGRTEASDVGYVVAKLSLTERLVIITVYLA